MSLDNRLLTDRESACDAFRAYVENPYEFWNGASRRQAEKVERKKRTLVQARGWASREIADRLLEQAAVRHPCPPVYITGLGGSGSHWLAGMLGDTEAFFDAGEVYFPPRLIESFAGQTSLVPQLIDALHLLHARETVSGRERAVNCAAGASHTSRYLAWDPAATVIYLIRDPRDQVLSTTFRKGEYRSYLGGEDDRSYLMRRCDLSRSDRRGYLRGGVGADVTVRYEEMRSRPDESLSSVITAAGAEVEAERILSVVQRHDSLRIAAGEETPVGNINLESGLGDWRDEAHLWVAAIHAELADVIESLGYPFGTCLVDPWPAPSDRLPGPPPPGIRLLGWTGQDWSEDTNAGPWLAQVLDAEDDQREWLGNNPLQSVCAVGVKLVSDAWLHSVLSNTHLRTLDLGTVPLSRDQVDCLVAYGSKLQALGLWRSIDDFDLERVRAQLPTTTIIA